MAAACGGGENPPVDTSSTSGNGGNGGGGQAPGGAGAYIPCAPGELELPDGSCQAPGVPADGCGSGFAHDGDAGCEPILPSAPCPDGQLAQLGETTCHAVFSCGSGKWDGIPTDATTQYVDQSFGGSSNGSSTQPWTTIQQALNAAASGAVVAVAAGNYAEDLSIAKPVELWGACPSAVSIGSSGFNDAVFIANGADGTEVHRVALTGEGVGVTIQGAAVLLEEVYIHDTSYNGVSAYRTGTGPASLTIRKSLVERAGTVAVNVTGSTLLMEDSVVRKTQPSSSGTFGRAFSIEPSGTYKSGVTLHRVVMQDNVETGMSLLGSDAVIEDTLIENTASQPSDGNFGFGIGAWAYNGLRPNLTVRRSVSRANHGCGICGTDATMVVERTVTRDMLPLEGTQELGYGMRIYSAEMNATERSSLTVTESLSDNTYQLGIPIVGGDFLIENSVIRNVKPRMSDGNFGRGISPEVSYDNFDTSVGVIRGVRVENAYDVGIFVVGSDVDLDSVYVKGIRSRENDGIFGAGIAYATEVLSTMSYASGTVNRAVVEDCQAAGFGIAGAEVTATDLIVRDTGPQTVNDDFGDGIVVSSFLVLVPDPVDTLLDLTRATVIDNNRAGAAVFGATLTVQDAQVSCNQIDLAGEEIIGQQYSFEDRGGNDCNCIDLESPCRVLSSGLTPPNPLGI